MRRSDESGSAILFIVVFMVIAGITSASLFNRMHQSHSSSGSLLGKKKSSYLGEGIARIAQQLTHEYLREDSSPTTGELQTYVNAKMTGFDMGTNTLETLQLTFTGSPVKAPVPSGPFEGMDSFQIPLEVKVNVRDNNSQITAQVVENAVVAKIGLFQFAIFSDLPVGTSYLVPGLSTDWRGRVHINGDFCYGNFGNTLGQELRLERITMSGAFHNIRESVCWTATSIGGANGAKIATNSSWNSWSLLNVGETNGCTSCGGGPLDWKAYALDRWQGNVLDTAHDVKPLKLPIPVPPVQFGALPTGALVNNAGGSRFLVDPVLSTDDESVRSYKLAALADIRIINGVWYLKNPQDPTAWPGVPIWSDHPGTYQTANESGVEGVLDVGQEDIRARWASTPAWVTAASTQWPANGPARYSYYEYQTTSTSIPLNTTGVISYGNLFRESATVWKPGYWSNTGGSVLCGGNTSIVAPGTNATVLDATLAPASGLPYSIGCTSPATALPDQGSLLLSGTRSGFRDGTIYATTAVAIQDTRSKMLPVNFDMAAFQAALLDTSPGELGSYFGANRFMLRDFNGIVYITQTWPHSMDGMGSGYPGDYPYQGGVGDSTQNLASSHPAVQRALPYNLCSAPSTWAGGLAGTRFAGIASTGVVQFRIPDCTKYMDGATGYIGARPNVVRFINANNISTTTLPRGFTLATNLPAYILGDVNTSSIPDDTTGLPWAPVLVAADQVMLLSKNWNDANSRWDEALSARVRMATNTTYHLSILSGGTTTVATPDVSGWGGGIENLPRYIERWNNTSLGVTYTARVRGSMVLGFYSAYFHNKIGPSNPASTWGPITYLPPARDFAFDNHLSDFWKQPPGAPIFDVLALKSWERL